MEMPKINLHITPAARWLVFSLIVFVGFLSSCKKTESPNPYGSLGNGGGAVDDSVPSPFSITGLHQNIFFPKCANPGCHDGTFEPDFRTVQSTFSTMVYMAVNKLTVDSITFFQHRVLPGNATASFLMERLITQTSDYMPSNGQRLSAEEIGNIRQWIMDGCPDLNGDLPQRPNLPPNVLGYVALNSAFVRIDTMRSGGISYNPFIAPLNSTIYLPVLALDTADGTAATDPFDFTVHELRFSTLKDDFTSAQTVVATWFSPYNVWMATLSTNPWIQGTTVYFRVYMNDGFQALPTEFPRASSPDFYKTYFAFTVQ